MPGDRSNLLRSGLLGSSSKRKTHCDWPPIAPQGRVVRRLRVHRTGSFFPPAPSRDTLPNNPSPPQKRTGITRYLPAEEARRLAGSFAQLRLAKSLQPKRLQGTPEGYSGGRGRQRDGDDFLVVANKGGSLSVGRMAPDDFASKAFARRFKDMESAKLLVTFS